MEQPDLDRLGDDRRRAPACDASDLRAAGRAPLWWNKSERLAAYQEGGHDYAEKLEARERQVKDGLWHMGTPILAVLGVGVWIWAGRPKGRARYLGPARDSRWLLLPIAVTAGLIVVIGFAYSRAFWTPVHPHFDTSKSGAPADLVPSGGHGRAGEFFEPFKPGGDVRDIEVAARLPQALDVRSILQSPRLELQENEIFRDRDSELEVLGLEDSGARERFPLVIAYCEFQVEIRFACAHGDPAAFQ